MLITNTIELVVHKGTPSGVKATLRASEAGKPTVQEAAARSFPETGPAISGGTSSCERGLLPDGRNQKQRTVSGVRTAADVRWTCDPARRPPPWIGHHSQLLRRLHLDAQTRSLLIYFHLITSNGTGCKSSPRRAAAPTSGTCGLCHIRVLRALARLEQGIRPNWPRAWAYPGPTTTSSPAMELWLSLLDFLQDPVALPVGARLRDLERENTGFKSTPRNSNSSSATVSKGSSQ
ncbi:hypothetical protein HPB47_015893 [Ixodes persulcatus]|uniref:Uncharacterized protein n=1 Tax=Ixodes persulcatus TaxID=34615 RepID=A0AC60QS77_IXOPE|nr:hypothetical protein HPB47_015893 [Ixodes persulcatus]